MAEKLSVNESIIVGVDFTHGEDVGILIVGRQVNGSVEVINAFQGKEAADLYRKLVTKKPSKKGGV